MDNGLSLLLVHKMGAGQGGDHECDSEHGLAHSRRPEEGHVGAALHEGKTGKVLDLAPVEIGLEGEIELIERLLVGKPGELERVSKSLAFPDARLLLQDKIEEFEIADADRIGPLGQAFQLLLEVGET